MAYAPPREDTETRLELLRTMCVIREFEQRCEALFRAAKLRGALHLCTGQEAVATGVCSVMEPGDGLSFTYRGHGWALARGITPEAAFAECFGRVDGCTGGRGGSKHLGDWNRRILPSNAIVAGGLPLAAGLALAAKLTGTSDVAVAVFGEGATNQGVFHETMTMASVWDLPIVFVCEDNLYSELTPAHTMLPVATISDRAAAYGMSAVDVDGMDVEQVAYAASEALERARTGGGPTFLVAHTYRFCGHMTGDAWRYRPPEEVDSWRERDPITVLRSRLLDGGVDSDVVDAELQHARDAVAAAEQHAEASPLANPDDVLDGAASWVTVAP